MVMSGYLPAAAAFADTADESARSDAGSAEGSQPSASGTAGSGAEEAPASDAGQPDANTGLDNPGSDAPDAPADSSDAQPPADASDDGQGDSGDDPSSSSGASGSEDGGDAGASGAQGAGSADGAESAGDVSTQPAEGPSPEAGGPSDPAQLELSQALSLVYLAEPEIAQGQVEQIAMLLADEASQVAAAQLALVGADGSCVTVEASNCLDNGVLFDVDTAQFAGEGLVCLASLSVTLADGSQLTVDLAGGSYSFTVDAASESFVDLSAYTVDADGQLIEAGSVEEALAAGGAQQAATAAVDAYALDTQAASKNLVIALDPGHDASSAGASAQGLREEQLTLKIAQACRDELQTYPGVTVYMTRDSEACPYFPTGAHSEKDCLKNRVADAVKAGASVFVSIHINSSEASTSHGAEVWYPNSSAGDASVAQDGKNLAQSIQNKLVALGLANRGAKENDTYFDNDDIERDYYSVIRNSKINNTPGVIIEHAFITSRDDYAYLASDASLKKLGVADAQGIAAFFGLSKQKDNSGIALSRLALVDVDGAKGQATLRVTDLRDAARCYAKVTFADGSTTTVEFKNTTGNIWDATLSLPAGFLVQEVGVTAYKVDAAGKETQCGQMSVQVKLFSDLVEGAWYLSYVGDVVRSGIMTGYTDSDGVSRRFGPEDTLTRAQVITMLYRLANPGSTATTDKSNFGTKTSFNDVPKGEYFTAAVQWGVEHKIVTGDTDDNGKELGTFRPYDTVSREELATMLARYASATGLSISGGSVSGFPDAAKVATWAKEALAWCNAHGIVTGDTTTGQAMLNPQSGATRAQAAKMFDVFSGVVDGREPTTPSEPAFSVSALSCRMQDEGAGFQLWTPAGEVSRSGKVRVAIWKKGSDISSATWYDAHYVSSASGGTDDDFVGSWVLDLPQGKLTTGTYTAQVWAAPNASASLQAFSKVELSTNLHPIMNSSSKVTASVLAAAYKAQGIAYPAEVYKAKGAATIEEFCKILVEEATAEGVDPGIVFVQAMLETGYLRFGGAVKAEQCNFAGLGATDDGAAGATFSSVREGLRAQVQHLRLYADPRLAAYDASHKNLLANPLADKRFFTYLAGVSPYLEGLGTRWASGSSYGWTLASMLDGIR